MTKIRQRKYLLAIAALVLVFAGCKGESPTAPTSTPGGQGGGGGVTPPTGATVAISVSNPNPLVDSTTTVTATVTQNNQPVANGTAVQFTTTPIGTFTEANANTVIRTTTNGVATATLTSSTAGNANVTATVNNVSAKTSVTFSTKPVTPPPPNTTPTITSISPTTGKPAGGDVITITGTNFAAPVRVVFDYGSGVTKEAQVVSVSATQIQVISPPVDLGSGQTANATINVIVNAGTPNEQKVSASSPFVYQAAVLTPKVYSLSPSTGPIDGGTRVTIFGEGFQAPLQVFFTPDPPGFTPSNPGGEAQVLNVTFSQVTVIMPSASSVAPSGSGVVIGPVDVKVVNVNSNTSVINTQVFRYTPGAVITAAGPTEGIYTGGTRVTIDGQGFNDPVAVVIGGVAAQPIKVSGTQIIAITSPVTLTSCGDVSGPITVTNIDNGDTAIGPIFIYRVPKPTIVNVSQNNVLGGNATITVINAAGVPRLSIGGINVPVTGATVDPVTGATTFSVIVPAALQLSTQACPSVPGAAMQVPTSFDVVYTSATSGCTDTLVKGFTIVPPAAPVIFVTPATLALTAKSATVPAPPALPTPAQNGTGAVQIANIGTTTLTIATVSTSSSTTPNPFSASAPPVTTLAPCQATSLGVTYQAQAAGESALGNLSITSNGGQAGVSLSGTTQ